MTYNDVDANKYMPEEESYYGYIENLGAFDIAAIQYLYGPNVNSYADDTTWYLDEEVSFGWYCLWDNGGVDTITAERADSSVTIDLRNATLENEVGGGGYISQIGREYLGYTIAYNSTGDCIIENAIGSDQDDTLRGNEVDNILNGRDGTDIVKFGNNKNDYTFEAIANAVNDGVSSFNIQGSQIAGSILKANEITTDPDSISADSFKITSTEGNDTSTDSLLNVEVLRFADGDYLTKNLNTLSPDYSYSWQTSTDGVSWEEISNSSSFNVEAYLDGQQIRLVINYSDYEGFEEEVTTDAITIPHLEIDTSSSVLEGDRIVYKYRRFIFERREDLLLIIWKWN